MAMNTRESTSTCDTGMGVYGRVAFRVSRVSNAFSKLSLSKRQESRDHEDDYSMALSMKCHVPRRN